MGSGASSKSTPQITTVKVQPRSSCTEQTKHETVETVQSDEHHLGDVIRKCITFLKTATSTGGNAVRLNETDNPSKFQRFSARREKLRPAFVTSLEELHVTEDYTTDTAMDYLLNVCEMSDVADNETANYLISQRYPELFVKIWKAVYTDEIYESNELERQYVVFNLLKQATLSFTHVACRLCTEMGNERYGIVPLMAREFEHPLMTQDALKSGMKRAVWDSPRETLKKMVTILANIIRKDIDNKPVFRQANVVHHLQELLNCRFLIMRAKALFCLVYLINDDENEALNTTNDNIKFVLKVLGKCLNEPEHYCEHYTYSAAVVMDGISFLAANDNNKVNLVQNNIVPKLITMMKTDNLAEKRSASRAVWKLAFHEENKENFKNDKKLIEVLTNLSNVETDAKTLNACKTVLWMLDVDNSVSKTSAKKTCKVNSECDPTGKETCLDIQSLNGDNECDGNSSNKHVMVSYQWGVQTQMIQVKQHLRAAGFNMWMDVDNMGGSTLESMAAAVEQSAVVLVCLTEKYKNSPSCRTEAEYTYKLQKPIIPLLLQEEYDPDGWLGIMIGTKLYVDFSASAALEGNLKKLKQLLGDRGRLLPDNQGPDKQIDSNFNHTGALESVVEVKNSFHRSVTLKHSNPPADAKAVASWTTTQVSTWLVNHGLGELKNRFEGYNGQRLLGLKTISTDAPDFFFTEIKKDFGFKSLLDIIKFKQALDKII